MLKVSRVDAKASWAPVVGFCGVGVPIMAAVGQLLYCDLTTPMGETVAHAGAKLCRSDALVLRNSFGFDCVAVYKSPRVTQRYANRRAAAMRAIARLI